MVLVPVLRFRRHKEEGVAACLSMVLAGIFMVLFGPSLIHAVVYLRYTSSIRGGVFKKYAKKKAG